MTPRRPRAPQPVEMRCTKAPDGTLVFQMPEPCSANRWWRKWRNRMVLSDEARAYKALVRMAYRRAELRGDVGVALTWYRGRKAGDLDKRIPIILDALQGVAYATDAQITRLSAERIDAPRCPRVVVQVYPVLPPRSPAPEATPHTPRGTP